MLTKFVDKNSIKFLKKLPIPIINNKEVFDFIFPNLGLGRQYTFLVFNKNTFQPVITY